MNRGKVLIGFIGIAVLSIAATMAIIPLWDKEISHQIMIEGIELLVCSPAYPSLDVNPYHLMNETDVLHDWSDSASSGSNGILLAATEINDVDDDELYLLVDVSVLRHTDNTTVEGLIINVTATYILVWAGQGASHNPTVTEFDSYQIPLGIPFGLNQTRMLHDPDTNWLYDVSVGPNALRLEFNFDDSDIIGTIAGLMDIYISIEVGKV